MIAAHSSPLDKRRLATALAGQDIGCEVQVHDELGSTNDHARELGIGGFPHGLVVLAESQTAGRGRRDNLWQAESGRDVLMSVLLRPQLLLPLWPRITTLAALSICQTIEAAMAAHAQIKWPNDVYLRDRKAAGILAETFTVRGDAFMVLGIGMNTNSQTFPPELRETATSLLLEHGSALDRTSVVIALLKYLAENLKRIEHGFDKLMHQVRARSWLLGKNVEARTAAGMVSGIALDLNEEGHLIVRDASGAQHALSSAEHVRTRAAA